MAVEEAEEVAASVAAEEEGSAAAEEGAAAAEAAFRGAPSMGGFRGAPSMGGFRGRSKHGRLRGAPSMGGFSGVLPAWAASGVLPTWAAFAVLPTWAASGVLPIWGRFAACPVGGDFPGLTESWRQDGRDGGRYGANPDPRNGKPVVRHHPAAVWHVECAPVAGHGHADPSGRDHGSPCSVGNGQARLNNGIAFGNRNSARSVGWGGANRITPTSLTRDARWQVMEGSRVSKDSAGGIPIWPTIRGWMRGNGGYLGGGRNANINNINNVNNNFFGGRGGWGNGRGFGGGGYGRGYGGWWLWWRGYGGWG